jgi:dolichyl-diphosphooligosaccharide--protein glycosyltransferase
MSQEGPERKRRIPPAVIAVGVALFVIFWISIYLRIVLPHDQVFVNDWVWFKGTDAWLHMRYIENLVHNFPHVNPFDPYVIYPGGGKGPGSPFFDLLVAGVIWLIGLGSPSQHTIDVVGAYAPAILGSLTIIPVYFIGKELFSRWVGVLAAALVVILPGEFLNRTLLGFTDHHVAESLFSTVTILFLILAIKRARERQITFTHLLHRDWPTIAKPLIYTLLAGIFLGIYLLSWKGGPLVVFIISVYLVIQFIIDHLRGRSTDYLCIIGTLSFLIAFIMIVPGSKGLASIGSASLLVAMLTPVALSAISRLMASKALKPAYYPLAFLGLAGIGFAVFHAANPSLLHSMLGRFSIFTPAGASLTILEVHPLLLPYGQFSLTIAWANFTTTFFISFISLGWLIYAAIREESADKTLFLVWSIVMLIAVLGQRRFSYYYAINAALLTGYLSWRILDFAGLRQVPTSFKQIVQYTNKEKKKGKKAKARARARRRAFLQPAAAWIKVIVAGVVIFFLVFYPNIGKAESLAEGPALINRGWYTSLEWLGENSPEPFGDADSYYKLYESRFEYPETAYGVMSWWDYGYWIMRISHRIPNSNPSQGNARKVARFFIAQNETSANQVMDEMGSRYVVIDNLMPTTKFYAMPTWAGKSPDDYFGTYYVRKEGGELQQVTLFYPSYYNSTVVRLYNFDGKAVVPAANTTIVISWEWQTSTEGTRFREIVGSWSFLSYEHAEAYVSSQESGNYRIVGTSPLATPVPLEELKDYRLVHSSDALVRVADKKVPIVKIFEYVKPGE